MRNENSIGAVVIYEDKFLLLKFKLGYWGLVKVDIEQEESKEKIIKRLLKEDIGIEKAKIIKDFEEHIDYHYNLQSESIHKFVTYMLVQSEEKEVELSSKHEDFKWLPFNQAIEKAHFNQMKSVIRKANDFMKLKNK